MVLSCIDTIEMILSDWGNIGTEPSENLKNFCYKTPNLRAFAEVENKKCPPSLQMQQNQQNFVVYHGFLLGCALNDGDRI